MWDELERKGAAVDFFDPYCPTAKRPGGTKESISLTREAIKQYDAVIITSAHKRGVDYDLVAANAALILDTKNIFNYQKDGNIVLL